MMTVAQAVEIISGHRQDAVVIASQSARIPWLKVSRRPELDILFAGSMSKESSVGLGIALACPARKVIVLSGDGELLMNLGTLVTIANQAPANYYHFVMQNGVYAFTGGQSIPGALRVEFADMAKHGGYPFVYDFDDPERFSQEIPAVFRNSGPVFTCLHIQPEIDPGVSAKGPFPWKPLKEYLHGLRNVLAESA